ncbi:hypothetical protein [Pseudalkalibacillus sp. SCS-8]|uniref:hypothetical protein n=1 Tax=Pseudalkalibacillus nanhaiensis TaxID=3115291 RepID=UPI0032D9D8C8
MRRMLIRALEHKKPIEIVYLSADETITQRVVWLSSMTEKTVTGYCSMRKQTRSFCVDRILSCRILPISRGNSHTAG